MKPRISIALLAIFIIGVTILTLNLKQQDEKQKIQEILSKGNYLVSLISLYPIMEFESDKRDYFLRTLTEYTSKEGFVYLFIHDDTGKALVSLSSGDISSKIPSNIQVKSITATRLLKQNFEVVGSKDRIFEFAKPAYKNGQRNGTIRLGLKLPSSSLFSWERISFLAMIAFLILTVLIIGYYGVTLALKPLKNLDQFFVTTGSDSKPAVKVSGRVVGIAPIIDDLEEYLSEIKSKVKLIETDNVDLISKLGVTTFEKNKIVKILDSINFGIIITDIQENIDHINAYMLKLLDKKPEDVILQPFSAVIDHSEITSFVSHDDTVGQSKTISGVESIFPETPPGEIFKVSASYLVGGENTPIGKIISFHNATVESLAEKAKHEFIAHVAHEILTPITNIKSYSEMLMDGEIEDIELQKEFYNTINEQTNRLADMVKNLLNISKMEMGSLTLDKGLVKTDGFFEDCISSIEASALEKNITIEKNQPDIFPNLMADKDLIKTAIINVLGNALKYTPPNGSITLEISEQDRMVVFDIIDTGYGISSEELPHIFEKFYRSDNPQVTDQDGSGLGLATTSEIVHLHGGEINVESTPGRGTHFTIKLPMEEFYLGETR
jgi:signal transduction histidine kinase